VLELKSPILGEKPCRLDVEAGRLQLVIRHAIGRHAKIDGDADLAGFLDVVQRVRMCEGHDGCQRGDGKRHRSYNLFQHCFLPFVLFLGVRLLPNVRHP